MDKIFECTSNKKFDLKGKCMQDNLLNPERRAFLTKFLFIGGVGLFGLSETIGRAHAMGAIKLPVGMQKVKGMVKINGQPARIGSPVKPGDVVTTGPDSMAIFVIGKDVYLIRDNTRIDLQSESAKALKKHLVDVLRILNGKMLAVFGRGRKRLEMPTAIAGVRGSGIYVESEPERTYICTCYGHVDITPRAAPALRETVRSRNHEAPRYVYAAGRKKLIEVAPVINHTDDELIYLESLVRRQPPFIEETGGNGY
jgi:hypothetical protein